MAHPPSPQAQAEDVARSAADEMTVTAKKLAQVEAALRAKEKEADKLRKQVEEVEAAGGWSELENPLDKYFGRG